MFVTTYAMVSVTAIWRVGTSENTEFSSLLSSPLLSLFAPTGLVGAW